jgi:hypothetical protein
METWHYTYVNPKTGKGWTDDEEEAIASFMGTDGCGRMEAIRRLRNGQINGTITVPSAPPTLVAFSDSTPAINSPAWTLFAEILTKFPGLTVEEARDKANVLIQESAGRKRFAMPKVLSEAELVEPARLPVKPKPALVVRRQAGRYISSNL